MTRFVSAFVLVCAISFPAFSAANEAYDLSAEELVLLETGVRSGLIDPDSARFSEIIATKSPTGLVSACGMVNAKNRLGGYVGNTGFFGSFRDTGFELRTFAQDAQEAVRTRDYCRMFGIWP